ncbi:MAG TPA: hypothetical protein RMH99_23345 [Sandaracinaceae bacterium LLY-WYZ-13_1]|nr:hypothetical protein [Sandaracinaceae bacterium LLY-WYZ-13_1]
MELDELGVASVEGDDLGDAPAEPSSPGRLGDGELRKETGVPRLDDGLANPMVVLLASARRHAFPKKGPPLHMFVELGPARTGGVCPNFVEGEERRARGPHGVGPSRWERLRAIEAKYDPEDRFDHGLTQAREKRARWNDPPRP